MLAPAPATRNPFPRGTSAVRGGPVPLPGQACARGARGPGRRYSAVLAGLAGLAGLASSAAW